MQTSTNWKAEYENARDELRHYYEYTDQSGFSYGYNAFPPFIKANGHVTGPLAALMDDVASDLGVKSNPVHCTWDDFAEQLASGHYATVAVPVMPIHLRAFSIVAIVELHCGALFFSREVGLRIGNELRHYTNQIRSELKELGRSEDRLEDRIQAIENSVRAIANAGGCGLAAGRQYLEYLLLQRLNAPIKKALEGPDLARQAQLAVDEGLLCVIDLVTLRLIEEQVGNEEFKKNYKYIPLLGDWVRMDAGLPFVNRDVGIYLHHRLRYDVDESRSRMLQSLNVASITQHATGPGFRIIAPGSLAEEVDYPAIHSTRDRRYYQGLSALLFRSTPKPVLSSLEQMTSTVPMLVTPPLPRASLPPAVDLRETLNAIDNARGDGAFEAVRMSLREIAPAQQYVIDRYHEIIDRKYLGTLTASEDDELTRLEVVLNDMEEPFYEKVLGRLRALRDGEV